MPWLQDRCGTVSNEVRLLPLSGALSFRNYCSPSAVMGPGWHMHFAALLAREVLLSLRAPLPFCGLRPSRPRPSDCHFLQPRQSVRASVCLSARPSVSPSSVLRVVLAPHARKTQKSCRRRRRRVIAFARSAGKHDRVAGDRARTFRTNNLLTLEFAVVGLLSGGGPFRQS